MDVTKIKAVTPPEGCMEYLTPGKKYEIDEVTAIGRDKQDCVFSLFDDFGNLFYAKLKASIHLNRQDWIVIEEKE